MKTTINLADDLMDAVRERARQQGTTMRVVVEEALRRALNEAPPEPYRLDLPVTVGRRSPTIDSDSNAEIDAYFDAAHARR